MTWSMIHVHKLLKLPFGGYKKERKDSSSIYNIKINKRSFSQVSLFTIKSYTKKDLDYEKKKIPIVIEVTISKSFATIFLD